MSTKKATKRALLTSILAICLCLVMLIGSTFAWFTDTASTSVNTITSGNLDVEIMDKEGANKLATLDWVKSPDAPNGEKVLWEPGCTYELTPFVVKNVGNLALKYKLAITGIEGDTGLLEVIKFTVKMAGTEGTETTVDLSDFEGHLKATEASAVITVSAHMDEAAGNDYMNKTLEGVKIEVYATQDTVEYDSTGNQYDKGALYGDVTVVNVTPETVATTNFGATSNVAYNLEAGDYGDFSAYLRSSENVMFIAAEGATFNDVTIGYHAGQDGELAKKANSTLTVKGFNATGHMFICAADQKVVVEDNTAAQITVKTFHIDGMSIIVNNNNLTGGEEAPQGNGVYIVPNATDYDLTITGNTFANIQDHAIHVQGSGDGNAVTAAKSITVTGNIFTSYGLNDESNRAAFKIWADTKLAPNGTDPINDAAKALAESIKTNNTFAEGMAENCILANFYGQKIVF